MILGDGDPHHPLGTLRAVPLQPRRGWGEGDPRGLGTFRAVPPRLAPLAVFPLDTFRAVPPPPRWGGGSDGAPSRYPLAYHFSPDGDPLRPPLGTFRAVPPRPRRGNQFVDL